MTEARVPVTVEDRDRAYRFRSMMMPTDCGPELWNSGIYDGEPLLQEFARHRLAGVAAGREEAKKALVAERRRATDAEYMLDAVVQMLGPKGRKVWDMWQAKGVQRIHTDWVVDPSGIQGEHVACLHLQMEEATRHAQPIADVDAHIRNAAIRERGK